MLGFQEDGKSEKWWVEGEARRVSPFAGSRELGGGAGGTTGDTALAEDERAELEREGGTGVALGSAGAAPRRCSTRRS